MAHTWNGSEKTLSSHFQAEVPKVRHPHGLSLAQGNLLLTRHPVRQGKNENVIQHSVTVGLLLPLI